jgi:hypothetical protein
MTTAIGPGYNKDIIVTPTQIVSQTQDIELDRLTNACGTYGERLSERPMDWQARGCGRCGSGARHGAVGMRARDDHALGARPTVKPTVVK